MKSNEKLQQDVEDALRWEPSLHAAEIGVTVNDGIVTLLGTVDNYSKKLQAEHAAKNVSGVRAVVEKIEVKLTDAHTKTDEDLAAMALRALRDNWSVPDSKIKMKVEKGCIYLEGQVSWNYQKTAAKKAVEDITGVQAVINNITIRSETKEKLEKRLIEDALRRHWSINADDIAVTVSGPNVKLSGVVSSLYQKEEAARIAWKTPGVWSVDNNLIVEYEPTYV
jgi:osmotically-inducible protein OsmY